MIDMRMDLKNVDRFLRLLPDAKTQGVAAATSAARRAGKAMRSDVTRGVKLVSFLKSAVIRKAATDCVVKSGGGSVEVSFRVATRPLPADRFRLKPSRVTARKGRPSRTWTVTGFQAGPAEPFRYPEGDGRSKGFVIRGRGGAKIFVQRVGGSRGKLARVRGYPVQYFAAFKAVYSSALDKAAVTFEKRLLHEIERRLLK